MDRNRKKNQQQQQQQQNRITVYGMFHPRADVDRSYFRPLSVGSILNGLEECVLDEEMELAYCVQNITEQLQKTVELEEIRKKMRNNPHKQTMRRRKLLRRLRSGRQAPPWPDIVSNRTSQG